MQGHLVERKPGETYAIVVTVGRRISKSGKNIPDQKWITFNGTKTEAKQKLNTILTQYNENRYVEPSRITTEDWLNEWLDNYIKNSPRKKYRTRQTYESVVKNHLIPALGDIPLQKLKPVNIQAYYNKSQLSLTTLEQHHAILFQALKVACINELIYNNPAERVSDKPKGRPPLDMTVWNADEIRAFLNAAREEGIRSESFYTTAIETGARKGELCGLKWTDINFELNRISICRQLISPGKNYREGSTKTGKARAISISDSLVELLRQLKEYQDEVRGRLGSLYINNGFVFTKENGMPLQMNNLGQREFKRLIEKSGVKKIRFHDIRHTCATLLLENGMNPKVVQERLGHSDISMTLNRYSHVTQTMQNEAAKVMGNLTRRQK